MAHYKKEEMKMLGLKSIGDNVLISKDCRIYSPEKISIGDNVRIDDFCILSGEVTIGRNVHLAPGVQLAAGVGKILVNDFAGLAFNTVVTASTDDFSGRSLTGPTVPSRFKVEHTVGQVVIGRHVIVGSSCVILPNVVIGEGCSVGALSLVAKNLEPWGVYVGSPVRKIKNREKDLLELERQYREDCG